jgi:poly(A) RNA polymerase GLD2
VSALIPLQNVSSYAGFPHSYSCAHQALLGSFSNTRETLKQLSEQMWAYYRKYRQSDEMFRRKLELREKLSRIIRSDLKIDCELYIVGSSLNGFGSARSDMDVCLIFPQNQSELDQRGSAVDVLTAVWRRFCVLSDLIHEQKLIHAKVPILRVQFEQPYHDIQIDLNANNPVGIRNTRLLRYYAELDPRVKPLVLVVKEWARGQDINDASRSTLSSYSLELMVIHYLQCGVKDPVLPVLHKLCPSLFDPRSRIEDLDKDQELPPSVQNSWRGRKRNELSLGELFLGFLEYYTFRFNFENEAISVRLGSKIDKKAAQMAASPHNNISQWRCLCIEEPFTRSNTARSVYDERAFGVVKQRFQRSLSLLVTFKDLDAVMVSDEKDIAEVGTTTGGGKF